MCERRSAKSIGWSDWASKPQMVVPVSIAPTRAQEWRTRME